MYLTPKVGLDPISPKLALRRNARYEIRKQASPLEHFLRLVSSAYGLTRKYLPTSGSRPSQPSCFRQLSDRSGRVRNPQVAE
jgi:hypothetical protein